jgi:hypothetical protein
MHDSYKTLWERISNRLSTGIPDWEHRIESMNQIAAVEARARGHRWSDDEVFKGLILSILSNSANWAIVEKILPDLDTAFCQFRLKDYAVREENDIERLYAWFTERHAASTFLREGLTRLRDAANVLIAKAEQANSLDHYFEELVKGEADLPSAALALGGISSRSKLPGLGIPLAAEFLKNIGYDVSKPDRHINRAAGSFRWVEFRKWPNREGTKAPTAREVEMIAVMGEMATFSSANSLSVCYADNAVWLLCAKSGLYLDNEALSSLGDELLYENRDRQPIPAGRTPSTRHRHSFVAPAVGAVAANPHQADSLGIVGEETNHDRIADFFKPHRGREFSTAEITRMLRGIVATGSVRPNDHADADHIGCCSCAGKENRIFERVAPGRYRVC